MIKQLNEVKPNSSAISMKKMWFIFKSILGAIWHDIKTGYNDMSKPREILNMLFWLIVILIFTGRYATIKYAIIFYVAVYIWKIIRQGTWKYDMRQQYR